MSRYDKYDPETGGFRAQLLSDFTDTTRFGRLIGVGLDASGRLVIPTGTAPQSGIVGVIVLNKVYRAGMAVDVMTDGEVVEFDPVTAGVVGTPGTRYYATATTGAISTTNTGTYVGTTVEGSRLIVRVQPTLGAGTT